MMIVNIWNGLLKSIIRGQKSVSVVFSRLNCTLSLIVLLYTIIALTIILIVYNCYYPEFSFIFSILGWSQFIQMCLLVLVILKYKK